MRWKWIAFAAVALIVALAATAYLVLSTYDYAKLKPRIERVAAEATGRKLTLGGEVGLKFGLSPALVVTNVTLANASWASEPQMITVRRIEAKVRLLPLLLGNVELKYLTLAGVDMVLATGAAGQRNWEFTAPAGSAERPSEPGRLSIAVGDVRVENLSLTYRDEKAARTTRINLAGLEVARQADPDFLALKLEADYNGQPVELAGRIGRLQRIVAGERFPLDLAGRFSSAAVNIAGSIGEVRTLQGLDLNIRVSGKNLQELGRGIGAELPQTDEFDLSGHLAGSAQSAMLENINGNVSSGGGGLAVSGRIGHLLALQDLDLQLKGSGKDLAQMGAIVGQKLPPTDEFTLEGRLAGSGTSLSLHDVRGEARRGSLRLTAEGVVEDLPAFRHVDLWLKGTGNDLAQAESIIGQKLPPTDEFSLEGRLAGSGTSLSLHDVRGEARRGSLRLTAAGAIGDLLGFRHVELWLKGTGMDLAEAGTIIGVKLPPTDEFELQGRLAGSAEALSLEEARGEARRGSLNLEATGAIKDLAVLAGMDLKLKADGKELAEIGPLVGATLPELGPFDFSGHLSGSARSFSLADLTGVIDQSDFKGLAKVEFRARPKISLVLESSLLDMTALLKNLDDKEKDPDPAPGSIERRLFSNDPLPLDIFKQVDADVSLHAKNVRTRDANFEFGRLMLTLENGDLNVDTLQATYKQTRISGNFHLYPESPPRVAAKFLVQDFDLGGLLRELRLSEEVQSHLDIAVDVDSRGSSLHDLMGGLNGSVGAVMGQGYLTHYLDLLSLGLTRKVIHFWGEHHKGGEIKCAVVQFDISSGLASSRAFVFDTEAGVLTGEGDINLATEQVNFLLVPEPRFPSLMDFWTKLRVSGPIMDPKVRPDTLSLLSKGAKALSALVIGPLGLLAPFVNLGAHKAHPCNVHGIGK